MWTTRRYGFIAAAVIFAVLLTGCSQAGFGEAVNLPGDKHASLVGAFASGKTVALPGDTGFNLADSQRSSTGTGQADSAAEPSGRAKCAVSTSADGTASAEFQLGHVLDNGSQEPTNVTVRFDVDYECRVVCEPEDASKQPDHLGLRMFVRDSNQRVLTALTLTEVTPFNGPKQWTGRQSPTFDVTLEPGLAYYVVLAGKTTITGAESAPVSAEIEVNSLTVELFPRK